MKPSRFMINNYKLLAIHNCLANCGSNTKSVLLKQPHICFLLIYPMPSKTVFGMAIGVGMEKLLKG